MHIVSFLSIIVFGLSVMKNYNNAYELKRGIYKYAVILTGASMSWSALFSSQFYIAESIEMAWFWHRLVSVGYITIIPSTSVYMIFMGGKGELFSKRKNRIIFYLLPFILIIYSLFGKGTPAAKNVVQSGIGLGWTYTNDITSIWLWLYIITLVAYMSFSIYILNKNNDMGKIHHKAKLASFFSVFVSIMITLSFITDIILPLFTDYFIPLGNIFNIVPILTYAYMSNMYDIVHADRYLSSEVLFKTSTAALLIIDENGIIFFSNKKAMDLFGDNEKELLNNHYEDFIIKDDNYYEAYNEFLDKKCFYDKVIHTDNKDGIKHSIMISAAPSYDKRKNLLGYIVSCQDVTKIISVNEILEKQNNTDELTGLLNRSCFFKTSTKYIQDYNEKNVNFAVIYIDLDRFKTVNEKFGHSLGDLVLKEISTRIKCLLKEGELLFRISGDEFAILVNEVNLIERINELEVNIEKIVNVPLKIQGNYCDIGISCGSELFSEGRDFGDFIKNANNRMYRNKIKKKEIIGEN